MMSNRKLWELVLGFALAITMVLLLAPQDKAAEAAFPVTVTDHVGNKLTFRKAPVRIISLAPSHTETLFALGAADQVIAVDEYSDWPPEVSKKAKIGSLTGIDYEYLVGLQPDLVIGMITHAKSGVAERLESLGIPMLILEPQNFAATYDTITLLGQVTGHEREANRIIADMKEKVGDVARRVSAARPCRVFYEVWPDPLMTAGPGSFIQELITLANGQNIAADADNAWPMFSLETLLVRDPEVIITPFEQTIKDLSTGKRPQWSGIAAVRNQRYYQIDPNIISRPGPRLADGLRTLAQFIHPEVF